MQNVQEYSCFYIGFLRSLVLIHQNHHWITRGEGGYGKHLMFERIYNSAITNADQIAEKFVGLHGPDCLNQTMQAEIISKMLKKYTLEDSVKCSLKIEEDFLKFAETFFKRLKEKDQMTLGLDDALMKVSNDREEAVYFLKQSLEKEPLETSEVTARINLLKKIIKS